MGFAFSSAPRAQYMNLVGGAVDLYIDEVPAGPGIGTDVDATTWMEWEGLRQPKKITIETSAPGQNFTLQAVLVGLQGRGQAQPPVTLLDGMMPQDFVRDIKNKKWGAGFVQYTAIATVDQGSSATGDTHLITFTMTSQ